MVRVWDLPVRLMHWALVVSVVLAWATTAWFGDWHRAVGYVGLGVLIARVVWGVVGSRHARFARFVRGAGPTWRYLRLLVRAREPRHVGHNPLGAWMIVTMIGCLAGLALTGWLTRPIGSGATKQWSESMACLRGRWWFSRPSTSSAS